MSGDPPLAVVRREADGEPAGALVLLHGRGADEHDLAPLLDVLDPSRRLLGVTLGAPLRLPPGGKHWYVVPRVGFPEPETFVASIALLRGALDDLGVPMDRVVLGGFSQGTAMSLGLALEAGTPAPAGVLALSGFIPTVGGFALDLHARAGVTEVALRHGTADPVIPVDFSRDALRRLREAGVEADLDEHPGGHHLDPRQLPALAQRVAAWLPPPA